MNVITFCKNSQIISRNIRKHSTILKFPQNVFVWSTNQPIPTKLIEFSVFIKLLLCDWITWKVFRHEHDADESLGSTKIFQSITQCHLFEFIFSRFITLISLYFTLFHFRCRLLSWFWSFGSWFFSGVKVFIGFYDGL